MLMRLILRCPYRALLALLLRFVLHFLPGLGPEEVRLLSCSAFVTPIPGEGGIGGLQKCVSHLAGLSAEASFVVLVYWSSCLGHHTHQETASREGL